jgi:hypothetical protein
MTEPNAEPVEQPEEEQPTVERIGLPRALKALSDTELREHLLKLLRGEDEQQAA